MFVLSASVRKGPICIRYRAFYYFYNIKSVSNVTNLIYLEKSGIIKDGRGIRLYRKPVPCILGTHYMEELLCLLKSLKTAVTQSLW